MALEGVKTTLTGGTTVAALSVQETAELMIELARRTERPHRPYYLTSANGQVIARQFLDRGFAKLIDSADLVSADGQPLVFASRWLSKTPLPERVATTDLYPLVARLSQDAQVSFYLFGASEEVNRLTYESTLRLAPRLNIVGRSSGYVKGAQLDALLDEINELAPDILWLAMGVPLEQEFVRDYAHRLPNVKIIKTSGGLFDFVSNTKMRAPQWMQSVGLEWAFRVWREPKRLMMRYLSTNPLAALLLLTRTR